jgi:hypothetical protein
MAEEGPRWRKLTELVSNHVFIDVNWNELLAVMDSEGQTNEIWNDSRTTAPGFDDFTGTFVLLSRLHEVAIDEWSLF